MTPYQLQCWAGSVIPGKGSAILRRSRSRDQGSAIPYFNFWDRIIFWIEKRSRSVYRDRKLTILVLIFGIGIVFRKISDPNPGIRDRRSQIFLGSDRFQKRSRFIFRSDRNQRAQNFSFSLFKTFSTLVLLKSIID
jgi:hypothetical protein